MKVNINCEKLFSYMISNNLTRKQFAEVCKISVYSLNKMLKGDNSVRLLPLFRVCKVINISINELVR